MKVTPVSGIERETWISACIIRIVNDRVLICICNVNYDKYKCWTKHAFFYDIHYKPLNQSKCFGSLIDNRADAPICVFEDKDRETKKKL